jgi:hypothetical protein
MEGAAKAVVLVGLQSVVVQDLAYRELGFDIGYLHNFYFDS